MRWKRIRPIFANTLAVASSALLVVVIVFCVRAQVGSNDYVEWRSNDGSGPAQRPDDWAQWNDAQWVEWRRSYESWDRKRWIVHLRANPNAIVAFGGQPFYGYPANSFDIHFHYWIVIPALVAWPAARTATLFVRRAKRIEGSVPCPACGYDLRASPGRCPECGAEQVHGHPPAA